MRMLDRRQREDLEYMREQAKAEKLALNRSMEIMREAGIKRQSQFQRQLNAAAERERQTNQALQDWKQAYHRETQKAWDQKILYDMELESLKEQSRNTQRQIQSQLNTYVARERQQNDALRNLTQQRENARRELQFIRDEKDSLQVQLDEANKPGILRRIWNNFF